MPFTAGQKIRASDLNDLGGVTAIMTTDVSVTNSTSFVDATGLALALAADATYTVQGYVNYLATAASGMALVFSTPSGASGQCTILSGQHGEAPVVGAERINYADFGSYSLTSANFMVGSSGGFTIGGWLAGFVTTDSAGTLQLRVAQAEASVDPTTLKAGSWLRVDRV